MKFSPMISLLGPVGDFLHNIFNPFEYLADKLKDLTNGLLDSFQEVFINPPRPVPGAWQDYLYGNAIGLAGKLSVAFCVIALVVALFYQRRMISLLQGIGFAAFIGAAYPFYFFVCDFIVASGDDLARAAHWYKPKSGDLLSLPSIANVIGEIIGLGSITFWGGFLVGIFFLFELVIITAKFFGMIALAAAPLGERSRKALSWIISMMLVTMLFGRPAAVFAVDLGRMASDNFPFSDNSFGKTFYITVSLILAIIAQGFLLWATLKVTHPVVGSVTSRVFGQVETLNRRRQQAGVGGVGAHLASKGAVPVYNVSAPAGPPHKQFAAGSRRMGGAVAMKVATKVHPAAAAALAARNVTKNS